MAHMVYNPKTGRKEKGYQCAGCCLWFPMSDTEHHKNCKDKDVIAMWL